MCPSVGTSCSTADALSRDNIRPGNFVVKLLWNQLIAARFEDQNLHNQSHYLQLP